MVMSYIASRKDSMNLAYAISGMKTEQAKKYLQGIIDIKRPLPAIFHKRKLCSSKRNRTWKFSTESSKIYA